MADYFLTHDGAGLQDGTDLANAWSPATLDDFVLPGNDLYVVGNVYTPETGSIQFLNTSGTSENKITVRGDYPGMPGHVYGAYFKDDPADWTEDGANYWWIPLYPQLANGPTPTGKLPTWGMFGSDIRDRANFKRCINVSRYDEDFTVKTDITQQGEIWIDRELDRMYIYSVGNPTAVYEHCFIPQNYAPLYFEDVAHYVVKNLRVSHSMNSGMRAQDTTNWRVENCWVELCGSATTQKSGIVKTDSGNGITCLGNSDYNEFVDNLVQDVYDAGISVQLAGPNVVQSGLNCLWEGNRIEGAQMGLGFVVGGEAHSGTGIMRNNIILNTGLGVFGYERSSHHGAGIAVSEEDDAGSNVSVEIYDNIIDGYTWYALKIAGGFADFHHNTIRNGKALYVPDDSAPAGTIGFLGSDVGGDEYGEARGLIAYNYIEGEEGCAVVFQNNTPPALSLVVRDNYWSGCATATVEDRTAVIWTKRSNNSIVINNVFSSDSDMKVLESTSENYGDAFAVLDNNVYRSGGDKLWNRSGTEYTSLAAWAAGSGWDTNSTENDPFANTFGTFAVG